MDRIIDTSKVRYFPPNRLDQAPYGTVIYVDSEKEGLITYIQLSDNLEEPNWQKGRNLLEAIFQDLMHTPDFLGLCIKIFQNKDKKDYLMLSDIIKKKYGDQL